MIRVGLTGGIACGKSTVGEMLARHGAHLLNADTLAHELYAPGTVVYDEVVRHFGREILNEDGGINRSRLASLVFPDRIGELNAIVHPSVIEAQNEWMTNVEHKNPRSVAVVEAALLLEAGAQRDFDKVIVVTCTPEQKVERFSRRVGIATEAARAEVQRRTAAQLSDQKKASYADFVIDNSKSLEETQRQVDAVWRQLVATQAGADSLRMQ